jgi:hypothetical protein
MLYVLTILLSVISVRLGHHAIPSINNSDLGALFDTMSKLCFSYVCKILPSSLIYSMYRKWE